MITGIDETGDFAVDSEKFHYFIAVHIDQNSNKYQIKQSQYNLWEGSIPKKYKTKKGEVKGQLLPNEYIESFYNEVLKPKPVQLYSVVRIVPNENSPETVERHKAKEISSIERVIKEATEAGHLSWAKGYTDILHWYKNRNYQTLIKMKCLENLLAISLDNVLGWAQASYIFDDEDISNLKNIRFLIDKDFVRAEPVKILWGELFRQSWQNFTKERGVPVLNVWRDEDHPIFKVFENYGGKIGVKKVFREGTKFLESESSWEIRIADLVGTILHRYQNKGELKEIGEDLIKHLGGKRKNFSHIILNQ